MPYDRFESVQRLEPEEQRQLLRTGDPVERVWAAWALALRLGAAFVPELADGLSRCRFPGTRRLLIVVLAGLGARSVLEELAEHDPHPFVRATACFYLIRTAGAQDAAIRRLLLQRLVNDTSATVRLTILLEAREGKLGLEPSHLERLRRDPDAEVRQHALEEWRTRYGATDGQGH